ncbi:MAG: NUDIX domain-containing protein [archaeon]
MKKTKTTGGVVINNEGLILVVNQNNNSWSLPKGHINTGEDEINAAKREIYEESGIKIENLSLIKKLGSYKRYKIGLDGSDDKSELKEIALFLFKTQQHKLSPIDPDNPEAMWIKKEEVAKLLTHRKDKEFFIKIKDEI